VSVNKNPKDEGKKYKPKRKIKKYAGVLIRRR
jgi:hypothetical protein